MALSLYVLHLFYKFKVLVLVTLCLMVLWATFSYFVDSRQEISKAKDMVQDFRMVTSLVYSQKEEKFESIAEVPTVKFQGPCPALSPYLQCSALQRVAILIPHRNREKHLLYLLEHLHPFLQRQQLDYGIYVIHQAGSTKFNRAKLLNVGYLEALKEASWDCFIFHDVDLVPENDFNIYMCDRQPKHLVVGRNNTGYRLRYSGYFGGVTALTRDQFSKVNGFSNNYWGWGGEDDDLRIRVEMQKMKVVRPSAAVARYTMIFHKRDHGNEENAERMKLLRQVSRTWKRDGLNSCSYKLLSVEHNPLYINITVDFSMQPKIS
ncbi:beta-1,4-galactosyltransferase 4 isoform X2 [Apus apus]|uniref:beta-1,4-galactosyltransferase 4 isoform X2 n=1 Tax=Apus apus TaxID=8895 RepID=UPI0021F8972A|nr:beta-1,4-galactosyltransferase 4 isoform X2 [Apus apus]